MLLFLLLFLELMGHSVVLGRRRNATGTGNPYGPRWERVGKELQLGLVYGAAHDRVLRGCGYGLASVQMCCLFWPAIRARSAPGRGRFG